MSEKIYDVDVIQQAKEDMRNYAIFVLKCRAVPNFVDGLKPVIRRIIWCAGSDYKGQDFIKTVALTSTVVRKYNPHNTASLNLSLRNMIRDFISKCPTMEGSGNWGSKTSQSIAADRYTEAKISQFSIDTLLADIYDDKRSVDWTYNYDNKYKEPVYLAAKIPLLLVNGQVGIAVGVKTSIPSHNLGEVIDATVKLIKNPNAKICLIPDECMSCEIIETDFQKITDNGSGTYVCQSIIDIGDYHGKPALYIRSLPDFTFFEPILDSIKELVTSGKMPYIDDMISKTQLDDKASIMSDKTNFEEIVVLKRGADPNFVREFLYVNTGLRQTRQVKLYVTKNDNFYPNLNCPKYGYKEYLLDFINFRRATIYRKFGAKLQAYSTRTHELRYFLEAMTTGTIDKIVSMIKKQKTRDDNELIQYLIDKLRISNLQAKRIISTDLRQFSKGNIEKFKKELEELNKKRDEILNFLSKKENIDEYIINEMLVIKKKYNTPRMCKIISKSQVSGIAPGKFQLIISKNNFIKKIGIQEQVTKLPNDDIVNVLQVDNTDNIMVFSVLGNVYKMPVHKIPLSDKRSAGTDIRILNKWATSNICAIVEESMLQKLAESKKDKYYIFIITKKGFIKKIDIADILSAPTSGFVFSKLSDDDEIKQIRFALEKRKHYLDIVVWSGQKIIRFDQSEVPYLRRFTKGNKVFSSDKIEIDGMNMIQPDTTHLLTITEKGYVNRIPLDIIPKTVRNRAGSKVSKLIKGDKIKYILGVNDRNIVSICDNENYKQIVDIVVADIPVGSTLISGQKLLTNPTEIICIK